MTYFCPALDPPLDGSGRKTTTLVRDLEFFIQTKLHQNQSSGSGEEVENVNWVTDDRRQTTDAGQRVITIGHWSLRLLCPKKDFFPTLPTESLVQSGIPLGPVYDSKWWIFYAWCDSRKIDTSIFTITSQQLAHFSIGQLEEQEPQGALIAHLSTMSS